jgi:hypothetical protein
MEGPVGQSGLKWFGKIAVWRSDFQLFARTRKRRAEKIEMICPSSENQQVPQFYAHVDLPLRISSIWS